MQRPDKLKVITPGDPAVKPTVVSTAPPTVTWRCPSCRFLGPAALASRQYANAISHYVFLCSLAIGLGTSILVGRLVGGPKLR